MDGFAKGRIRQAWISMDVELASDALLRMGDPTEGSAPPKALTPKALTAKALMGRGMEQAGQHAPTPRRLPRRIEV